MSLLFENQKIIPIDIEKEMKKSYIDYSMSVIVGRALPDVRDGLKPVHRRILYAMYEDSLTHDKPYRKSATTVGNVLGRYHPHGDAAVYDSLVRMAQSFSLRYPLIDGHGNFGSIDGHPAAAYRYTEARMNKISQHMLRDIEKDTVEFGMNYDDKFREPTVLTSKFPNLLVNGSTGIAVGMATNIPPHNLVEVINGVIATIDNPEIELEELLAHIKGPDFPTGGIIMGTSGMRLAYATGRGKIKLRSKVDIEEWQTNRYKLIVTEIPYMVNKARLIESIANLVKDKRVDGISNIRDESDRNGLTIAIELKRDANPQVVLNTLYKYTQLEDTVSMIMLALVNNQPKILTLREILDNYIDFQREIIERRTRFDLKKSQDRAHILEGLRVATDTTDNIDRIIEIIRSSPNETEAKVRLTEEPFDISNITIVNLDSIKEDGKFYLSEIQAKAITDMRLGRLSGLERQKIEDEFNEIAEKIANLLEILSSKENILAIVREELIEIKAKFGDDRRTSIENVYDDIDIEDLIEETECVYTLTNLGYIKRVPTSTYKSQKRGGRGVSGMSTRDEDIVKTLFTSSTHSNIMFFTSKGRVYRLKGYHIPESSRTARGMNIINLLELDNDEKITAMIPVSNDMFNDAKKGDEAEHFLFFVTRQGVVKRIALADLDSTRKAGVRALTLNEEDTLVEVRLTDGIQNIIIGTFEGQAVCFEEKEVRAMGRTATGVRGIKLREGDYVIGAGRAHEDGMVLTITENGYGKRTKTSEFAVKHRGGVGVKLHEVTEKTGNVIGLVITNEEDDVMLITSEGVIIRTDTLSIRECGRASQGVIVMKTQEDVKVISIERTEKEEEIDESDENIENIESIETVEENIEIIEENNENTEE
ncbi:MAG: DNA gyrase subunit A [Clostridia bacterium]